MQNREFLKTLKKGDKLYIIENKKGRHLVVTKIGRKYFYCHCINTTISYKFDLETGCTVQDYGSPEATYKSEQDYLNMKKRFEMCRTISDIIARNYSSDNITTKQLQAIIGVLNDR